jgi:SecD/SecF fusion protein
VSALQYSIRFVLLAAAAALVVISFGGIGDDASAESACGNAPDGRSLELVYQLQAGEELVTAGTRDEAVEIVCRRLRAFGVTDGEVSAQGARRVRVVLPHAEDVEAERVVEQLGTPGRLFFYDWEPNLLGRERRIGGHPAPSAPAGPLSRAEREWKAAGRDVDDPANKWLIRSGAFATARRAARLASKASVDTVLLSELPVDRLGRVDVKAPAGWYALKDDPALSGSDILDPRQETDAFGLPNVTFSFTEEGRVAFERVTRAIARRGMARVDGPVTDRVAERLSGQFALVFDREVKTRPIINFAENPNGIDGRVGAQISGGFSSVRQARDLAAILRIGALPIDLVLARQRTLGD